MKEGVVLCVIFYRSLSLSLLVKKGNRKHGRYFKQEEMEFTELATYKIMGRAEAVDFGCAFQSVQNWLIFLHSGTQTGVALVCHGKGKGRT